MKFKIKKKQREEGTIINVEKFAFLPIMIIGDKFIEFRWLEKVTFQGYWYFDNVTHGWEFFKLKFID